MASRLEMHQHIEGILIQTQPVYALIVKLDKVFLGRKETS
jgi:hypothetical protein